MSSKGPPGKKTQLLDAPDDPRPPPSRSQPTGFASGPPPTAPPPPGGPPAPARQTGLMDAPAVSAPRAGRRAYGRWVAGPLLAIAVAGGTVAVAHRVHRRAPAAPPSPPQGRLRLQSDPPGASLWVDGKLFPHFTPTVIDGALGSTMKLRFKLDGFLDKEAEVYVLEGERPFNIKLERAAPIALVAAEPVPVPPPKPRKRVKEAVGNGKITVLVRPWAIVFVDGKRIKQTPIHDFELLAGKHQVELVNEGLNRRERLAIDLKVGEVEEIRREWAK